VILSPVGEGWAVGCFSEQILRQNDLIRSSLWLDEEQTRWCLDPLLVARVSKTKRRREWTSANGREKQNLDEKESTRQKILRIGHARRCMKELILSGTQVKQKIKRNKGRKPICHAYQRQPEGCTYAHGRIHTQAEVVKTKQNRETTHVVEIGGRGVQDDAKRNKRDNDRTSGSHE